MYLYKCIYLYWVNLNFYLQEKINNNLAMAILNIDLMNI